MKRTGDAPKPRRKKQSAAARKASRECMARKRALAKSVNGLTAQDKLSVTEQVAAIQKEALQQIRNRQAKREKLTAADYTFLEKMLLAETVSKSPVQVRQIVQEDINAQLQQSRVSAYHRLVQLLDSKREDVALQAAIRLREWADEEEPPPETYETVDAQPQNEKVISITEARKLG